MNDVPIIEEAAVVLRDLDAMWVDNPPLDWRGEKMSPVLGSAADQEQTSDNPYWEIVRRMPLDAHDPFGSDRLRVDGYACRVRRTFIVSRDRLAKTYAWSIPTPADIAWITALLAGRGVVEVGAGTGYWAWQLTQAGVDVLAFDAEPGGNNYCGTVQYHPVQQGGPTDAAGHPDRALLLCWPPYGSPMATEALRAFTGDLLIYIGEGDGGCTGDEEFFALRSAEWEHVGDSPKHATFAGIHCFVEAYRRKGVTR